jgi:hypothetical protein
MNHIFLENRISHSGISVARISHHPTHKLIRPRFCTSLYDFDLFRPIVACSSVFFHPPTRDIMFKSWFDLCESNLGHASSVVDTGTSELLERLGQGSITERQTPWFYLAGHCVLKHRWWIPIGLSFEKWTGSSMDNCTRNSLSTWSSCLTMFCNKTCEQRRGRVPYP